MQFEKGIAVRWVADFIDATLKGNTEQLCTGINEIHKVVPGDISFVDFEKYYDKCLQSAASTIIINKDQDCPAGKTLLICDDPFAAFVKLVKHFRPFESSTNTISATAQIGLNTVIQPNVFIGNHVKIGQNCILHANVSIYDYTEIGDNVIIHSGTVIGADAFYYKRRKDKAIQYDKLESCGKVIIQDAVEIGANCTIDKGVSGDTIIGAGTKMDNLVHVAHGVVIGKNCLIAAQVGIAGKTHIEDEVTLWGQAGINKDLVIGRGAVVNAQSGVPSSIEGGKVYFGSPVLPAKEKVKELYWVKQIPEIWSKLQALEEQLKPNK